jgi:hypothetical protein
MQQSKCFSINRVCHDSRFRLHTPLGNLADASKISASPLLRRAGPGATIGLNSHPPRLSGLMCSCYTSKSVS